MPKVYTESQKKQWVHEYQSGKSVKKFVPRMVSHQTPYMDGLNYLMRQ